MPYLFKYVTAATGQIILKNKTLRWSSPPLLNDPFDMQFAMQLRFNERNAKSLALQKLWDQHYGAPLNKPLNELGSKIQQLRNQFPPQSREDFDHEWGAAIDRSIETAKRNIESVASKIISEFSNDKILCLTDTATNILMWSYYAENHSGIVLRFRDDTYDNPFKTAKPIRYVEQLPSLLDDDLLSDMLAGYSALAPRRIIDEVVWTKSHHWMHEREWRIYTGAGRTREAYEDINFASRELDGVIFGARTSAEIKTEIIKLVTNKYVHASVLQANLKLNSYEISIDKFIE